MAEALVFGVLFAVEEAGDLAKDEKTGEETLDRREEVMMGTAGPSWFLKGEVTTVAGLGTLIWKSCGLSPDA